MEDFMYSESSPKWWKGDEVVGNCILPTDSTTYKTPAPSNATAFKEPSPAQNEVTVLSNEHESPASFRLKHVWVVEVIDWYMCGLCHDARLAKFLSLVTGKKFLLTKSARKGSNLERRPLLMRRIVDTID